VINAIINQSGVTHQSFFAGVCAACILAYRCLQMKGWAAVTVVAIPSQKALLMCPYVSSGKCSLLAPRCSRALLHNLQPTSDRHLGFASHSATGMIDQANRLSVPICLPAPACLYSCFLHLNLCCPFSYCIPHAIIQCRMTILIS